ncbi:SEC-C domain-containing protein [Pseudomonas juntendi]|jgi:SEC-C motif|uniref:SEC-C domain-containing protein n=2 Tax=Pseudomonas TaxID=286 RepID=A0A9X4DGB1_9PSED|nr:MULTISPECIES: SEC-C domain-containing protein [Pseudomonas]MBH3413013.1 SEC-C domain-containing protein [Pseudomonas putida]MBS3189007.1 SEC-C domain-containing protein [Pseudomonas sp. PCH44]MCE0852220.1 SEC-C domain-containing protein [Pseudomonas asiatica]MCE0875635.1 SEC-C domain-containing protein [Pseudomonas monteilii]MCE0928703.1 SEC-C domain-containing protein [Pseudomonas monteilii]
MKLPGRNERCWCKSGKKFKHCHLDIDRQPPVAAHTVLQTLGSFKKNKKCSVPQSLQHECSGGIINAHTVSKSSSLKAIARNGHVLKISIELKVNIPPKIKLSEVGINSASTFTGFCASHDKKLFSTIEDQPFKPVPSHCFLIMYRGISREIFSKEYASKTFDFMRILDRGKSLAEQVVIQNASALLGNNNSLTTSDLKHIKSKLDTMLVTGDYSDLNYAVFTLESPPPIMGSAIVGPTFDFDGYEAQKITSIPGDMPDYMTINSFASDGKGFIVLSWLSEHSLTCNKLIRQFLDKKLTADSLAAFMVLLIENFYISPSWWESLDNGTQALIKNMYSQGVETHTDGNSINIDRPLHFPAIINVSMNPTL